MLRKLSSAKVREVKEVLSLNSLTFRAGISTATQSASGNAGGYPPRVFADFEVFKGKAALSARPILPKFAKLDSGDSRVDRKGVILLSFSPAIGERKYDWEKKQHFALSATEIGSLISLGSVGSCEFFHDPSMQSSNAGQVRKSLQITARDDGTGYFISLSVANNILKTNVRMSIPVTTAEFAVLRIAFSFALPHLMGWERFTNQLPGSDSSSSTNISTGSKTTPVHLQDIEWWDK